MPYNGITTNQGRVNVMLFDKQMERIYRSQLYSRQDNPNGIFYFSPTDFPGLQAHPYSFRARAGHTLSGYFYHYDNPVAGRLVVFDHGMGNGHRAYMREIERLARGGYLVFAYDHTGCMESGGQSTGGFAQSLNDLDACIKALKKEVSLNERTISVVGHSWGGFSTMNIAAIHPDITHVVSMSGFISVKRILKQFFAGPMSGFVKSIHEIELKENPRYALYNALESLSNTSARVLLIYSDDDKTVKKEMHYDPLYERLSGNENIQFLLVHGKDHNPTYTCDAVKYKNGFFTDFVKAAKRKQLNTPEQQTAFMEKYDFWKMTEQDEQVWDTILAHLEDRA